VDITSQPAILMVVVVVFIFGVALLAEYRKQNKRRYSLNYLNSHQAMMVFFRTEFARYSGLRSAAAVIDSQQRAQLELLRLRIDGQLSEDMRVQLRNKLRPTEELIIIDQKPELVAMVIVITALLGDGLID
jgi:hypothetical protein